MNHLDATKELIARDYKKLPEVKVKGGLRLSIHNEILIPQHEAVELINYNPNPSIKAPLSVGMGH